MEVLGIFKNSFEKLFSIFERFQNTKSCWKRESENSSKKWAIDLKAENTVFNYCTIKQKSK